MQDFCLVRQHHLPDDQQLEVLCFDFSFFSGRIIVHGVEGATSISAMGALSDHLIEWCTFLGT